MLELPRGVHKTTTKVERSHQFTKYLNFGGEGRLRTNSPADSESEHKCKSAVNVAISDATFSYVEHEFNDLASAATSVTIDRVTGKYFAYSAHSARKDGRCKKVE
jgi:hypothetical protein